MQLGSVVVNARWDEEAGVWVATSEDIPGLVAEAEDLDVLEEKIKNLIPDLIELNGINTGNMPELPVYVMAQSMMKVPLSA